MSSDLRDLCEKSTDCQKLACQYLYQYLEQFLVTLVALRSTPVQYKSGLVIVSEKFRDLQARFYLEPPMDSVIVFLYM